MGSMRERLIENRRLLPDEILGHTGLYSQTRMLGWEADARLLRETGIRYGRPVLHRLSIADFPAMLRKRLDVSQRVFLLVEFMFDLDEVAGSRHCVEAEFTVKLDTHGVVVQGLWPELVTTQVDVERSSSFMVGADFSFRSMSLAAFAGLEEKEVWQYVELHPTIRSFGKGQKAFSWIFEEQDGYPLLPMSRTVFAILDLPQSTSIIRGSFDTSAVVCRRRLGKFDKVKAVSRNRQSFQMDITAGTTVLFLPSHA